MQPHFFLRGQDLTNCLDHNEKSLGAFPNGTKHVKNREVIKCSRRYTLISYASFESPIHY